jgi:hypothetical protein
VKYYRIIDDINYPQRWHLGDIIEVKDNWPFIYGKKIDVELLVKELHVKIYKDGNPMDYTTSEAYSIPIVSELLKKQLGGVRDLQFIPVKIWDKSIDLRYFIMVATNKLDCVNEELSVFGKFAENDPIRPDLAGNYSWFTKLIIDEAKAEGKDVFRIAKACHYLIISQRVKDAIEDVNAIGAKFIEV